MIYLAFTEFKTRVLSAAEISFAAILDGPDVKPGAAVIKDGRLLLEGRNVVGVRYERVLAENVSSDTARARILAALARRQQNSHGPSSG